MSISYFTRCVQKMRAELEAYFGNRCNNPLCQQTFALEFAHLEPTDCVGRGRGKWHRLNDVRTNLEKYTLLCQPCHEAFDGPAYMNPHYKKRK